MKRIAVIGIVVLILSGIFTGCSDGSDPDSMSFVDSATGREFTIYDNLSFTAWIPTAYLDNVLGLSLGGTGYISVSGSISGANGGWTSSPLTGMAGNLSSNDSDVSELLPTTPVSIVMTYTSNGEITDVNIAFPGAATGDLISIMSQALMGGTYLIK